jgi:hypothetical protein
MLVQRILVWKVIWSSKLQLQQALPVYTVTPGRPVHLLMQLFLTLIGILQMRFLLRHSPGPYFSVGGCVCSKLVPRVQGRLCGALRELREYVYIVVKGIGVGASASCIPRWKSGAGIGVAWSRGPRREAQLPSDDFE